jgi:LmbE family N-acetylglucosaminyl deacetylase
MTTLLESQWRSVTDAAPRWTPPAVPTLVVVPHPDDESLSTGGLIAHQRRAGVGVIVVAVTDGEASYLDVDRELLSGLRRDEQTRALTELGVDASRVERLGLPDGSVADHERELEDHLAPFVKDAGVVIAPWIHDHHTDHEAVGRAAEWCTRRLGVPLVSSLFWAWHHCETEVLAAEAMVSLRLDADLQRRRRAAIECHRSQLTDMIAPPILSSADVDSASWASEHYLLSAPSTRRSGS